MSSSSSARIDELLKGVPGFGRCGTCQYLETGSSLLCFSCARRSFDELGPPERRCAVCDLPFPVAEHRCHNPVCSWPDRWFEWNRAIALRTRELQRGISRFKFDRARGWGTIFGRILSGFLEEHRRDFVRFNMIVASPTFVAPGGTDHTRHVLQVAARESPRGSWNFDLSDPPAIVKTRATKTMVGAGGWRKRREVATTDLRDALAIPNPKRTRGLRILVYDDVFTTGQTLNEVARVLRISGGATEVCGVTLARQPAPSRPVTGGGAGGAGL